METKTTKWAQSTSPDYNGPTDPDNDFMCATQLERIAGALEEILRLVKIDQEKYQKLNEKK